MRLDRKYNIYFAMHFHIELYGNWRDTSVTHNRSQTNEGKSVIFT
jgi:hypothetical protein